MKPSLEWNEPEEFCTLTLPVDHALSLLRLLERTPSDGIMASDKNLADIQELLEELA